MAYIVFALKWRPQNFDEIIGQNHISTTLKNTLEKNRIANAYLFAGPRGVGKTSTARILAKALNCKDGPTINPCGKCNSCVEIGKGISLDVIEIDGASNRQIDDIRALRENVKFSPTLGKFKIYIIDEVHMLTNEAFNALLKTLEEPPPFIKFIFATTHPHKIPSTILSRCQRLDFRRILTMEIVAQLNKIITAEKIDVDKEVVYAIAKSSDGSLRDAESILDQLVSFSGKKVSLGDVIFVLGLIEQDALFEITDKIIEKNAVGALELLNKIIDEGKDISIFLANLIEHFRNLMVAKITQADSNLIDLPQETCKKLLKQAQLLSLEEIFSFFNILVNTNETGKRLDSLRITLEITLVKLAHEKKGRAVNSSPVNSSSQAKPVSPIKHTSENTHTEQIEHPFEKNTARNPVICHPELSQNGRPPADRQKAQKAKNLEENILKPAVDLPKDGDSGITQQSYKIEHSSVITVAVTKNNEESIVPYNHNISVTLDDVKRVWQNAIDSIGKVKMSVATYFTEGSLEKVNNNVLTVSFPKNYSFHKESLEKKDNKALIEKILSGLLNNKLIINFILSQESAHKGNEHDSLIKNVLETFNGRVISEG